MPAFYHIATALVGLLFRAFTRCQVSGRENVPATGPLVLVSNHLNNADIPLLAASIPRGIVFMAKEELFRPPAGWAIKACGALRVRRGAVEASSLRQALDVLKQGKTLGVYPEGTRSRTGRLQTGKPGVAMIARHSQAPISPVAVTGTEKMAGAWWWLRRPRVTVSIGKTFTLPSRSGETNKESLTALTTFIMEHIAELLPPDYRGVYGRTLSRPAYGICDERDLQTERSGSPDRRRPERDEGSGTAPAVASPVRDGLSQSAAVSKGDSRAG
ncbi:MAG: 1-acyl-sn-glycerol-3-phosphate acyltransferase [Chloroflexi bacterium]|nr:1-acyl-sn-glycerol-3-phosphate acyltransferase [Chloroflexota bacterium]